MLAIRIYRCGGSQGCTLELQRDDLQQAVLTCRAKARLTRQGYCLVADDGQLLCRVRGALQPLACCRPRPQA
jgi:hypothetical protein